MSQDSYVFSMYQRRSFECPFLLSPTAVHFDFSACKLTTRAHEEIPCEDFQALYEVSWRNRSRLQWPSSWNDEISVKS